jgi:hypothetical protein
MVEVRSKRCLGRAEPIERLPNEPWSPKQRTKQTTKTTFRSDRRSLLKKDLTEPTLLEMYGNGVYQGLGRITKARGYCGGCSSRFSTESLCPLNHRKPQSKPRLYTRTQLSDAFVSISIDIFALPGRII